MKTLPVQSSEFWRVHERIFAKQFPGHAHSISLLMVMNGSVSCKCLDWLAGKVSPDSEAFYGLAPLEEKECFCRHLAEELELQGL